MVRRVRPVPLLLLVVATVARLAPAATFTYPDFNVDPAEVNWDATAGIASGDTVILLNGSTSSSSNDPITNSGTLELRGGAAFNNPYVFSLGMTGSGGVVVSNSGFASLTGTNSYSGGTLIDSASLIATTASLPGDVNNQGVLRFDQSFNGTFAGNLTGGGTLQRYGTGTVTLSGTIATPFEIFNSEFGGRLVGTTDTIKGVVVNQLANLEFAQNFDGTFQGDFGQGRYGNFGDTGNIYKTGTGALTLTGNNRFTTAGQSDLFIDGGRVQGPAESLDFNGTITIASGAQLRIVEPTGAFIASIQSEITGQGTVYKDGPGTVDLVQSTNTYAGSTTVADGKLLFQYSSLPREFGTENYSPMLLTGSGSTNTVGIEVATGNPGAFVQEYSAAISGPGSLTVTGNGNLKLTGSNSYSGGSFVGVGARLIGTTTTIPGAVTLLGAGSAVEYEQATNATLSAVVSGDGAIYKTGTGSLTLATNSSLTGDIYVRNGALIVNNEMPNIAMVRMEQGGVLKGSGTIGTAGQGFIGIDIDEGTLAPGNSAGVITASDLDVAGSQTAIEWELMANTAAAGARGTSYDGINLSNGNLTIGSGAALDLVFNAPGSNVHWWNSLWDQNQSWVLIDGVANATLADPIFTISTTLDSVGGDLATLRPGAGFATTYDSVNGDILINYTAAQLVPEPATLGLAGLVALGGLGLLRRRRRG